MSVPESQPDDKPRVEGHIENPLESSPEDELVAELMEHTIDVPVLASAVEAQEPADAAETLETLPESDAADILEKMDLESAAEALSHMMAPLASGVLDDLAMEGPVYAARLLEQMAPDDAADLLQDSSQETRERILKLMSSSARSVLNSLLLYDEESAGGIMNPEVLTVDIEMSVDQAVEVIRRSELDEESQYVYVVDSENRLVGILGLRRLVIASNDDVIGDICDYDVAAIPPSIDRETVAREFEKYDFLVLPVIDENEKLLGVVTVDDVIDSIRAESTEDAQLMVGAGREEMVFTPTFDKLKSRLPWLIINLLTSFVAAIVVLQL